MHCHSSVEPYLAPNTGSFIFDDRVRRCDEDLIECQVEGVEQARFHSMDDGIFTANYGAFVWPGSRRP